jgi:tRNA pseudouridine55 synthase
MSDKLNGIFLLNKELGRSSFSIVRELKNGLDLKKVGHAGTLDPLASGLLIIMVGKFTKRFDDFQKLDKEYEAEIVFGKETDTYDSEGKVIYKYQGKIILSNNNIDKALKKFEGKISQVPPAYSAVKISGKPAYKRSRAGETLKLKPKKVEIKEIKLMNIGDSSIEIKVTCSSGTYIRSLAYDLGREIGFGAYLSKLKRTRIGNFKLSEAKRVKDIITEDLIARI